MVQQLAPAIKRVARRAGRVLRAVTAGRGYGQTTVEHDLQDLGVQTAAIPRRGTTSPARKTLEPARAFRGLVKWRTGSESLISYLKHGYGYVYAFAPGAGIGPSDGITVH